MNINDHIFEYGTTYCQNCGYSNTQLTQFKISCHEILSKINSHKWNTQSSFCEICDIMSYIFFALALYYI